MARWIHAACRQAVGMGGLTPCEWQACGGHEAAALCSRTTGKIHQTCRVTHMHAQMDGGRQVWDERR
eukprot:352430-Chlamydomonas_euryale.AAC.2